MKKKVPLSRHHRKCRSNGGGEDSVILVPQDKHAAWHLLFGNLEAEAIAEIINTLWLDPSWTLIARRIKCSPVIAVKKSLADSISSTRTMRAHASTTITSNAP
jgi:hypothetical protein